MPYICLGSVLGFKEVKRKAIEKLLEGSILHEQRDLEKNLLASGKVSVEDVVDIIKTSRGSNYTTSPHHNTNVSVTVHIIKAVGKYDGFYVKFYFIEPDIWFISVHE